MQDIFLRCTIKNVYNYSDCLCNIVESVKTYMNIGRMFSYYRYNSKSSVLHIYVYGEWLPATWYKSTS